MEEATTPAGLKTNMDNTFINQFLKKAETLDTGIISFCLDAKLEETNLKIQQVNLFFFFYHKIKTKIQNHKNSLILIEALLNSNSENSVKFFLENTINLENLTNSTNLGIKTRSSNILESLQLQSSKTKKKKSKKKKSNKNNSESPQTPSSQSNDSPQQPPNNPSSNLLLFDLNTTNQSNPPSQQQPQQPNQTESLLGGIFESNNQPKKEVSPKPFSLLDDIKNLDIPQSQNKSTFPPMIIGSQYPPYPQQQVYYNQNNNYQNHSHNLQSNPSSPNIEQKDNGNDNSAFSFINDQIKKEVK